MSKLRKPLSIFLSFVMIITMFSILPFNAFADEVVTIDTSKIIVPQRKHTFVYDGDFISAGPSDADLILSSDDADVQAFLETFKVVLAYDKTTQIKKKGSSYEAVIVIERPGYERIELYWGGTIGFEITVTQQPLDDATVTVSKKYITTDVTEMNITKDDVTVTDMYGNTVNPSEYTFEDFTVTEAGTYPVTVTAASNGNYSGSKSVDWEIISAGSKSDITVTPNSGIIYDGEALDESDFTITADENADDILKTVFAQGYTFTATDADGNSIKNAGTYDGVKATVLLEGFEPFEYTLNGVTVSPRKVKITPEAVEIASGTLYDGNIPYTVEEATEGSDRGVLPSDIPAGGTVYDVVGSDAVKAYGYDTEDASQNAAGLYEYYFKDAAHQNRTADYNTWSNHYPINGFIHYGSTITIYTPDEVGEVTDINSLSLFSTANISKTVKFDIYLAETDAQSVTNEMRSGLTDDVITKVYSSGEYIFHTGENEFEFDKTFHRTDLSKNLVVIFVANHGYYGPTIFFCIYHGYGNKMWRSSTNDDGTDANAVNFRTYYGYTESYRAVMKFSGYQKVALSDTNSNYYLEMDGNNKFTVYDHTVTVNAPEHGTASASVHNAYTGEEITLTAEADTDYRFVSYTVLDEDNNEIAVTDGKFIMPDSDVTVTATFDIIKYTVSWVVEGETIATDEVPIHTLPEYSGETPVKESTVDKVFTFTGWSPEISEVTEDATYTAQFSDSVRAYTVTWKNGDTELEVDENVPYGAMPEYNGATPTKESTVDKDFTFSGWSPEVSAVTGDITYTAQYTATGKYTVIWMDGDTELEKDENVPYGTTPEFNGTNPTKESTVDKDFTFSGWSPEVSAVTGDITYTAQYTATVRKYTIVWMDGDTELEKDENVPYGTTPEFNGTNPTKESTVDKDFTFSGWSPEVSAVTGDTVYTAQFTETAREYTVTWKDYDGSVITTSQVAYGSIPAYSGSTPTRENDNENEIIYEFSGWTPALEAVTGDCAYTAEYITMPFIPYVDAKGNPLTLTEPYRVIDENTVHLENNKWYVLTSDVTNQNRLYVDGKANIILCDGATLTDSKGISVVWGKELTIWQQEEGTGALRIINGTADNYAGIGGAASYSGKITINGGDIIVTGGNRGAGIGSGGANYEADVITINGGNIRAVGNSGGSGIGGGLQGHATVVINGGTVSAEGFKGGSGIGGGGYAGCTVTINGGNVTATGNINAAGIGSGTSNSNRGKTIITINGGTVTVPRGGSNAAGIGTGYNDTSGGTVTINGGVVKSTAGSGGFGIGSGNSAKAVDVYLNYTAENKETRSQYSSGYNGTIHILKPFIDQDGVIYGVTDSADTDNLKKKTLVPTDLEPVDYIDAYGNLQTLSKRYTIIDENTVNMGAADTETWYVLKNDIEVNKRLYAFGDVNLILCDGAKFINPLGIEVLENEGNLTIYGQSEGTGELDFEKVAGNGALAAIGGTQNKNSGVITINGGTITAYGEYAAAGIGGGNKIDGTVIINGGTINAKGGNAFAAIGGGHQGNGYVTINGGNINADGKIGGSGSGTGTISLSWTNFTDSIKATEYQGTVTLLKAFADGDGVIYTPTDSEDAGLIAGKTLVPTEYHNHAYGTPDWTWAEDYSAATATFVCTVCQHQEIVNATVTSDTQSDKTIYTATAVVDGNTYTDTKEIENQKIANDIYNLTVEENIDVNILVDVNGHASDGEEIEKIVYTYPDITTQEKKSVTETVNAEDITTDANGYFAKSFTMAIAQANDPITATVYFTNGTTRDIKVSVTSYCESVIKNASNYSTELVNLCYAVLDYGKNAADYFEYAYDEYPSYTLPSYFDAEPEITSQAGIKKGSVVTGIASTQMFILSKATMRLTFKDDLSAVEVVSAKIGDKTLTAEKTVNNGKYSVDISGIYATELSKPIVLELSDGTKVQYAATDWAKSILTYSTNAKSKALAKSLYYYSKTATDYFA